MNTIPVFTNLNALRCPICKNSLTRKLTSLICVQGHCFDIATVGYVNLLLNKQKHTKSPGDSKEMLVARTDFLDKGYYKPLSEQINSIILTNCKNEDNVFSIADLGCGEGYYLTGFVEEVQKRSNVQPEAYGIDISKAAIKLAAKRTHDINWFVGNVFELPFKEDSLDILLCMFSMVDFTECKRTLKKNGKLIFVSAGTDHLRQLKEIIYPEVVEAPKKEIKKEKNKFLNLEGKTQVKYETAIKDSADIANLLKMTPHYWNITEERKRELYKHSELTVTVDVNIEVLGK